MTVSSWLIALKNRPAGTAFKYKVDGNWKTISWSEYLEKVIQYYLQMKKWGLKPGQNVGILSSTRWEWVIADMAIVGPGNISVPMYPNQSDEDLLYIINHSEIDLLVVENEKYKQQISRIEPHFLKLVIIKSYEEFHTGHPPSKHDEESFLKLCEKVKATDVVSIVYTSGTTGIPKGVVLLHEAAVTEVTEIFGLMGVKKEYTALTFLPYAHVMGRCEMWGSCFNGHTLAFAESVEKIKNNLPEIQPEFLIAVPRIFEKVYASIMAKIETQPLKQKLFNHALQVATEVARLRETKQTIPWDLLIQHETICRVVFAPIKEAFGGKLQFAVCGGAPLAEDLTRFFSYCGIQIFEGYGLTETCAAVTVNSPLNFNPGTVGPPLGEAKIKIAADGEILVKSKKCMKEYFKNPEATAEVSVNGYFATGDIGEFTPTGQLRITDRKKDLIKTANGKYVAPQKLEGLMKQDSLISQILIHGDRKKYITAIISIDEQALRQWAESHNMPADDLQSLYENPALRLRVQKQIQKVNSEVAGHEAVKKFEIVSDIWSVENGAMTPSMKLKRKFLEKKYQSLITEMYE